MKAARLHQYGKPLQVDEINIPKAKGESVLVRVGGAGVCHSDLHFMKGEWQKTLDVKLPLTVGHETAGYVEEMGELVQGFSKGDPVAIFGGWGCGICQNCKMVRNNYATLQDGLDFQDMMEVMQNTSLFQVIDF